MDWLRRDWRNIVRIVLVVVFFAGGGLFFDHIAHYGLCFHLTPIDHGVVGLIMIVVSIAAALGIYRWGK